MFLHVCSAVNRSPFGNGTVDFVEIWHDSLLRYATNLHQISYDSNMPFVRANSATDLRKLARNGVSLHFDCGSPDCGCSDIADLLTTVVYTHFYRVFTKYFNGRKFSSKSERLRATRLRVTDCGSPDCGSPIAGHPIAGHRLRAIFSRAP